MKKIRITAFLVETIAYAGTVYCLGWKMGLFLFLAILGNNLNKIADAKKMAEKIKVALDKEKK